MAKCFNYEWRSAQCKTAFPNPAVFDLRVVKVGVGHECLVSILPGEPLSLPVNRISSPASSSTRDPWRMSFNILNGFFGARGMENLRAGEAGEAGEAGPATRESHEFVDESRAPISGAQLRIPLSVPSTSSASFCSNNKGPLNSSTAS